VLCSVLFAPIGAAHANTYNVDLSVESSGSFTPGCLCSPQGIFYSPVYSFPGGSTVDFGELIFDWIFAGMSPGGGSTISYFTGYVSEEINSPRPLLFGIVNIYECGLGGGPSSPGTPCIVPAPVDSPLNIVLPDGGSDTIQLVWWGPFSYIAPTPIPSTWLMMLSAILA